jgi:hypothetical protein
MVEEVSTAFPNCKIDLFVKGIAGVFYLKIKVLLTKL